MPINYNVNPTTQPGVGPYGTVPGPTALPPSIWDQLSSVYPGLSNSLTTSAGNVQDELSGQLSPETLKALQDASAAYGISSGTIGSQFQGQHGLTQLGLNVEKQQQQGLTDFQNLTKNVGSMQTDPALAASISENNANLAAAPNPTDAANQAIKNAQDALYYAYRLGGGTGTTGTTGDTSTSNPGGLPTLTRPGTPATTTTSFASPAGGTGGGNVIPSQPQQLPPGAAAPSNDPTNPWNYLGVTNDPWGDAFGSGVTGNFMGGASANPTTQDFNQFLQDIMSGTPDSYYSNPSGTPAGPTTPEADLQASYDAIFGPGAYAYDMNFGAPISSSGMSLTPSPQQGLGGSTFDPMFGGGGY